MVRIFSEQTVVRQTTHTGVCMPTPANSALKVFVLGLDATSLSYLQENIAELPNFDRLLRNGRVLKPTSPATLLNATVWQMFASGLPPGELGHYFPMQWDPSAMRFRPMQHDERLDFEPFWNALADNGVKTIVFDAHLRPRKKHRPGHPSHRLEYSVQCAGEEQSPGRFAAAETSIRQEADQGRNTRQKITQDADPLSRRLNQVGAIEDGRDHLAHEGVRMAALLDGLFRRSSRRPQSLANLG